MTPIEDKPGRESLHGPTDEALGATEPLEVHEPHVPPPPPRLTRPPTAAEPVVNSDRDDDRGARVWAAWCHLAGLAGYLPIIAGLGCVICPLMIWLTKRLNYDLVDDQGREVVNFKLNVLAVGAFLLALSTIPYVRWLSMPVLALLIITDLVLTTIGAIHANNGERYRYPTLFRPLKVK